MQINSKILVIRFSSFGDVVQSLSLPTKLREKFPNSEIHWASREEFKKLIESHPLVHQVWTLDRKLGVKGLIAFAIKLRNERFDYIYDAHNNFRSNLIDLFCWIFRRIDILKRPTYRLKRFLLFQLRINKYQQPFSGQRDLIEPLEKWGISKNLPATPQVFPTSADIQKANELLQNFPKEFITLAPSAAYFLKRWPKDYWIKLIELLPNKYFVILGGPDDHFLIDITNSAPQRCLNLAGKCDLQVNTCIIKASQLLISNDTGLMHLAEQLGHSCIALMGPAPFGFPSRKTTQVMEINLNCRPCSKHGQGPCVNKKFHQCLVDITPEMIVNVVNSWK